MKYFDEIISDIKDKKELRALDEDFVKQKLEAFLDNKNHDKNKNRLIRKISDAKTYKQLSKSREYKFLMKEMRAELRKVYGVFILEGYEKRDKLLSKLPEDSESEEFLNVTNQLLMLHKSTKERITHYKELYDKIFYTITVFEEEKKLIDTPDGKFMIMDLACGLNPLSAIFIKDKIKRYYASDISSEDCEFIKNYLDKTGIDAIIFPLDLIDEKKYSELKKIKTDVCFIFKTLDGLERVNRDITERLLSSITTKYFAITFPTLSIGGKREIKEHRRLWLERLLQKLGWTFQKFLLESELLYVIKKG